MEDILKKYQDVKIDDKTQQQLNKPLKDESGFNEGHEVFLKKLIKKLKNGELDPHRPGTLYNRPVYDKLSEEEREKTDLTAINLMSMIRQIESLWKLDQSATFQIQNLVESVFKMKAKFEKEYGDVFII